MLTVYHKIFRSTGMLAATAEIRRGQRRYNNLAVGPPSLFEKHFWKIFLFSCRFSSVEEGPGGIYLSGQSPNPASRRHIRIDPSIGIGRSFSEFRTCCVRQSCASSIRESGRAKECAGSGKTRDMGGQPTSLEAVPVRRRPQIV